MEWVYEISVEIGCAAVLSLLAEPFPEVYLLPQARPIRKQNRLPVFHDRCVNAIESFVIRRAVTQNQLRAESDIHFVNRLNARNKFLSSRTLPRPFSPSHTLNRA